MSKNQERSMVLFLLSLAGLLVSILSGAWEQIPLLKSLCSIACRDTTEVLLVSIPVWMWGAAFYIIVAALALFRKELAPWIIAPAAGAEAALIYLMVQMKAPCVFCITNAIVVAALLAFSMRVRLVWQEATLALAAYVVFSFMMPYGNTADSAHAGSETGVAARVGDEVITEDRLDVMLGSKLLEMKREIYRTRRDKLEQVIVEILLQKEAKEQGKTPEQFMEGVAPLKRFVVSDAEIDKYMQDNQEKVQDYPGSMIDLRERVRVYLQQQKRAQALKDLARSVETKHGVQIYLTLPNPPRVKVNVEGAPTFGPADAPVTIVEFSDYECPACRSTHEVVKKVRAQYGDKVQWVYKDYPLRRHKDAFKAAEAAHCAGEQGKYWEFQERLFTAGNLSVESLVSLAEEMGLSKEKFSQCLNESKYKAFVERSIQDSTRVGIDRTPSFIINGAVYVGGHSFETFSRIIDEEIRKAGQR